MPISFFNITIYRIKSKDENRKRANALHGHDFLTGNLKCFFMEPIDKSSTNKGERSSQDPRERLQQNPALKSEEVRKNTSHGDKNDLLNEDPDEERRDIEETSEDRLSSAE
jgi:hypothetical protein